MDTTFAHDDALSNSDSGDYDAAEITLSRLSSRNLSAIWGHGQTVSLFNVARRSDTSSSSSSKPKKGDSPVLGLSWDNYIIARQVRRFSLLFPLLPGSRRCNCIF